MSKNPEAINHISENFKQLIHDFCNALDLDYNDFFTATKKVSDGCDFAHRIVRKAYNQAEADKGFVEPEIKPDDTKGMNKSWIVANHKSFTTFGKGSDLKNQVAEAIDSDPNLEYAKDKLTAIGECLERR